jgi:hypothetical protein
MTMCQQRVRIWKESIVAYLDVIFRLSGACYYFEIVKGYS